MKRFLKPHFNNLSEASRERFEKNFLFLKSALNKELRKKGENIKNAILRTGAQRLRPVLLTTLTTFFGLIPMAIGLNINFIELELNFNSPSSQWWLQLSNAIVFGVMFSFVLTLVITPCLIMIGETSKFFKSF